MNTEELTDLFLSVVEDSRSAAQTASGLVFNSPQASATMAAVAAANARLAQAVATVLAGRE